MLLWTELGFLFFDIEVGLVYIKTSVLSDAENVSITVFCIYMLTSFMLNNRIEQLSLS